MLALKDGTRPLAEYQEYSTISEKWQYTGLLFGKSSGFVII